MSKRPSRLPLHHTSREKLASLRRMVQNRPGNDVAIQRDRMMDALREGPITTYEAMRGLDCYDPRPRVMELRGMGHRIDMTWVLSMTESGKAHRIGRYSLAKEVVHA